MPDNESTIQFGLLAHGSRGDWTIEVDESFDGDAWVMSIEGPRIYLNFRLQNPASAREALDLLTSRFECRPAVPSERLGGNSSEVKLGRLGSAPVTLLKDDEEFPRFFILVAGLGQSAFRVTLDDDDEQACAAALAEIVKEIESQAGGTSARSRSA